MIGTVGEKTLDRTKTLYHYTFNCQNNLIFRILKFWYIKLRIQKNVFFYFILQNLPNFDVFPKIFGGGNGGQF